MAKMKQTLIKFISMGSMLTVKNNFTQQMQGLLTETTEIADMTGGMVFLSIRMQWFTPAAFRWREENIDFSDIQPLTVDHDHCAGFWQLLQGQTVSGMLSRENTPPSLLAFLLPHLPVRYVAVPMQTHDNHPMGFLLLFNSDVLTDKQENAKIQLINSLVGMLSVAIEAQHLLAEQKKLLNAFIKLIAGAIDEKSPYTGGHCQRVPVITKMLAKAAVEAQEGRSPALPFLTASGRNCIPPAGCMIAGRSPPRKLSWIKPPSLSRSTTGSMKSVCALNCLNGKKKLNSCDITMSMLTRKRWTQRFASLMTISTLLPAVILAVSFSLMTHWHGLSRLPNIAGRAHSTIPQAFHRTS
jgi:hypothetical protein